VHFFLKQRVGKGIWQNLFEFPCIESERPLAFDELVRRSTAEDWFPAMAADAPPTLRLRIENRKHVLSHRILYASFYSIMVKQLPAAPSGMVRITRGEMENYPIHRLMQGFWEEED
jgi:A/G-specific adenine glycosylase